MANRAGAGSSSFFFLPTSATWSRLCGALLAFTSALVIPAMSSMAASGPCSTDSSTTPGTLIVTCSGNIGEGPGLTINYNAGARHLDLRSTATITKIDSWGIQGESTNNVSIRSSGAISTKGDDAIGIYGFSNHGTTTITSSGTVSTAGGNATGIFAYSINGAVAVTSSAAVSTTGNGTIAGYGATGIYAHGSTGVTVTSSGPVSTTGASATGIYAESTTGAVSITSSGPVSTTGSLAYGLYAGNTGGSVAIDITPTGSVMSSASGTAIGGTAGTTFTVNNEGTISGNVNVTGGTVAFNNLAGGLFDSGATVNLLTGGVLSNAGTVSPGGAGTIATTALTGSYVQTSSGKLRIDADWGAATSDKLAVSGTAQLAGIVIVNPTNPSSTGGLTRTFTVLTAAGGITNNGLAVQNAAFVNYALQQPDANTLNVQSNVNFQGGAPGGLTANQQAVGSTLNQLFSGGSNLPFLSALLGLPAGSNVGSVLSQLAPQVDAGANTSTITSSGTFANQLLSCRVADDESNASRFIKEGQCVWARASARKLALDGTADNGGFRERGTLFSTGAQLDIGGPWRIGGGLAYETSSQSASGGTSTSESERLHIGGVIKYNPGPWLLAAAATGGWGWSDNIRRVAFGGFGSAATSSSDQRFYSGRGTAAYLVSLGSFYVKPQVELAVTQLRRDAYTERATGGIALHVGGSDATVLSAAPSLELGLEGRSASGLTSRVFVRGGAIFLDTDKYITTATFADAPGSSPFAVVSRADRTLGNAGAGVDLFGAGDTVLRLQYDGQFGEHTRQSAGSAKLSVKF